MIETNHLYIFERWHCREQLRCGQGSVNFALTLRLVFSCTVSIEFSYERDPQTCVCPPDQIQQVRACIFTLLHCHDVLDTFTVYPCNRVTSGSQHEIFWQKSSVDIILESSSIFQYLFVFGRWACNALECMQCAILFQLITKSLQNRCKQLLLANTFSTTWSACTARFIQFLSRALQRSIPKLFRFSNSL